MTLLTLFSPPESSDGAQLRRLACLWVFIFFYIIFYCFLYVKVSLSLLSRNGMNSLLYKWSKESDFLIRFYFLFRKLCKHVRVIETFFINLHRFSSILCVCVCAVAVTFTIIIKCLLPFSNKERSISRLNFVYLNSILRSFSFFHFSFLCVCVEYVELNSNHLCLLCVFRWAHNISEIVE